MKLLVVVDMQKDFIDGSLGTKEAEKIVTKVVKKIKEYQKNSDMIVRTMDTHNENYLNTQEGKNLPVKHCVKGTSGWELEPSIAKVLQTENQQYLHNYEKDRFGSIELAKNILSFGVANSIDDSNIKEVELVGLCTGICVITNAIMIKTFCPEVLVTVDSSCCACVTPKSHENAIQAMKLLQINIK